MKKKPLLTILILFIISFSSTTNALSTEEGTGVDSPGLYTYVERFDDLSGALTVTTTGVNNSGSDYMYITVLAICMDADRNFRLRIFDSDDEMFLEPNNEQSIGVKERRWRVRPHMDKPSLVWIASATDMTGEIIFAQISLLYTYDETSRWIPPGGDEGDSNITPAELRREVIFVGLSYFAIFFITLVGTGLVVIQREGKGVKHFFRSKFKGEKN